MKINAILSALLILAMALNPGCKSSNKASGSQKGNNESEITLPFSGTEYSSNADFFRARQSGTSPDLPTAKKIALQNAKAEIAADIESVIKRVTDQYTSQTTIAKKQEFKSKFEELSREAVNLQLIGATTNAEKALRDKSGNYTFWVVVEVPKHSILDGLNDKVTRDQNLRLDFDKSRYEKTFNEEMDKLEKENKK